MMPDPNDIAATNPPVEPAGNTSAEPGSKPGIEPGAEPAAGPAGPGAAGARSRRDGRETRRRLIAAAETCLREDGYAALSIRRVALLAGVPMSQIHYHFSSKQGLLLALFEDLNRRLRHRRQAMFAENQPLWRQWALACDSLDEDLASGYVRILHELSAAGWSDAAIGAAVRKAMKGWADPLREVARRAAARFGERGQLGPFAPEDVAALAICVFLGAGNNILSGHDGPALPVRRALRRFADLLRQFEERDDHAG